MFLLFMLTVVYLIVLSGTFQAKSASFAGSYLSTTAFPTLNFLSMAEFQSVFCWWWCEHRFYQISELFISTNKLSTLSDWVNIKSHWLFWMQLLSPKSPCHCEPSYLPDQTIIYISTSYNCVFEIDIGHIICALSFFII